MEKEKFEKAMDKNHSKKIKQEKRELAKFLGEVYVSSSDDEIFDPNDEDN